MCLGFGLRIFDCEHNYNHCTIIIHCCIMILLSAKSRIVICSLRDSEVKPGAFKSSLFMNPLQMCQLAKIIPTPQFFIASSVKKNDGQGRRCGSWGAVF